jgi:poly-gamma-glutamate synthesis protein (capsule biosynthesis protein)
MRLGFTGDVGCHSQHTNPFIGLRDCLSDVHMVVSLETPIRPPDIPLRPARQKILLSAELKTLQWLRDISTRVVCVGNNHIADYGNCIAQYTVDQLSQDWLTFGAGVSGDPFHRTVYHSAGLRVGFLSYCSRDSSPIYADESTIGPRELLLDMASRDVEELRQMADHVVIMLHWGKEHLHYPEPKEKSIGRELINMGADVVIGSHPHVARGYERHRNGYIFYSLGNTFFPNVAVQVGNRRYEWYSPARSRWSLLPIFRVSRSTIELEQVHILEQYGGMVKVSRRGAMQKRLAKFNRRLASPTYEQQYPKWNAADARRARLGEFLAKPDRVRRLVQRIGREVFGSRA